MPIGTPSVPYRLPGSQYERWVDIYTRLGVERILFLGSEVNDAIANSLVAQMLYLDRKSTRLNSSHTDISRMPSSA